MNLQKILILFFSFLLMACPTPDLSTTTTTVTSNDDENAQEDRDDEERREGGSSRRRGSSSSSSSSSSGGGSSSGGPARCSGGGVSVTTHTIDGDCPDTDGSALDNSRKLTRISIEHRSGDTYRTKDENALSDAPSKAFRVAGVGDSDPDQDVILAMWLFGSDLFIYTDKDTITSEVGHLRINSGNGFILYLNGRSKFVNLIGESVNEYKGKDVLIWKTHLGGNYGRILGNSEVDMHWARQYGASCKYWTLSGVESLSSSCSRTPANEHRLAEISFTEYGRYLKSGYEISMEDKQSSDSDPEQRIFLHYYTAGNKQIAVLNKSAISYSSSDTYYLYMKPSDSSSKTKYSLTALDGEYCGDNNIQHISFEVEDGPEINVRNDIWLAKETDDSCIFYTKN